MDALFTSIITVTIAEIGDKTQLLSLLLVTRFKQKLPIILGILIATLLNHAASAWLGVWLSGFLMGNTFKWILGGSFIAIGLWLLIPDKPDSASERFNQYGAFFVAALLFFLAEIGDKTQIATILLGAKFQSTALVTIGTTVGMLVANIPVIYAGQKLMDKIPLSLTRMLAAMLFIGIGLFSIYVYS